MNRWWVVARYEYRKKIRSKSYIFSLFLVPLLVAFTIGLGALVERTESNQKPLGYVDDSELLVNPQQPPVRGSSPDSTGGRVPLQVIAFPDTLAARSALEAGEIQAYYYLPPNFNQTNQVVKSIYEETDYHADSDFLSFLQVNRLGDLAPEVAQRAVAGPNVIVRWPADAPGGGREFSSRNFLSNFSPVFLLLAFITLIFINSSEMAGAVAEEKSNRTMEILVSTISPGKWIAGKAMATLMMIITQLTAWWLVSMAAIWITQLLGIRLFQNFSIDGLLFLKIALVFTPTFITLIALMLALSATVNEPQEAQQVSWLLVYPVMFPFFFLPVVMENPDSTLGLVFSLLPITSPTMLTLRFSFFQVPDWQLVSSVLISFFFAAGAVWLAGRALRLGMLRYGQKVSMKELFGRKARGRL